MVKKLKVKKNGVEVPVCEFVGAVEEGVADAKKATDNARGIATHVQLPESLWRRLVIADLESLLALKEKTIQEKELALLKVDVNNKERVKSQRIWEHNTALRTKAEIVEEIMNLYEIDPKLGFEYDKNTGELTVNREPPKAIN